MGHRKQKKKQIQAHMSETQEKDSRAKTTRSHVMTSVPSQSIFHNKMSDGKETV